MSEYDALLDAPASSAVSPYDALLDEPAPAPARASQYDALIEHASAPATKAPLEEIRAEPTFLGEVGQGHLIKAAGMAHEAIRRQFSGLMGPTESERLAEAIPFGKNPDGSTKFEYKPLGDRMEREQGLFTPFVKTEPLAPSKDDSALTAIGKSVFNVASGVLGAIESPAGALLPGASGAAAKAVGGAFGLDMLGNVKGQIESALKSDTTQGKIEGWLGAAVSLAMAGGAAKHAFSGKPQVTDIAKNVDSVPDNLLQVAAADADFRASAPELHVAVLNEVKARGLEPVSAEEMVALKTKSTPAVAVATEQPVEVIKAAVDTDVQKILSQPIEQTAAETIIPPETPLPNVPRETLPKIETAAPVPPADTAIAQLATPPAPSVTGIRNRVVDQERVARGLPPRMEPLRRSFGTMWDEAMGVADKDPLAGTKLAEAIAKDPRPLEDWESALLAHEQVTRQNAFDRAIDEVNAAPDEATKIDAQARMDRARDDVQLVYDVGQRVGTKVGLALVSRKLLVNKDYTLARMEAETRAVANEGKPLSEQQLAEVKTLHDRIAQTEKKLAQYEEREQARGSYEAFETLLTEQRHEAIQSAKLGKTIATFFDEQAEKAKERIIARRGKLFATADPLNIAGLVDEAIIGANHIAKGVTKFADWSTRMVADFGERIKPFLADLFERAKQFHETNAAAFQDAGRKKGPKKSAIEEAQENAAVGKALDPKLVYDLAREKVNAGLQNLDSVIKAVHADLLKVHEGLTEREVRDAFSGYGKTKFPSKEADLAKLRELRRLGQLVSAIEDAQRKEAPKKTGLQRDPPTQAIRDKLKELQKAMRENGIETLYPEQQLATANQARATALRNQIEDIDRQLRTGEQPPKGKPVPDTPEVERLRSERNAMKTQLEEIEEAAHPRQTPEERALESAMKAAKKSIERYDEMLKTGNLRPAPNGPRAPHTPELEALQAERNALRDAVNEMRRDEAPRTPPEELARKNALKALYKSIAEYDRRLKEGDFTTRAKRPGLAAALSEIVALRAQRDAMRDLFQKVKKAAETTRSPDEIQLARDKKAIATRTEKLRAKIAAGDYEKPAKKAPVTDAEKTALLFENQKAKEEYARGLFEANLAKRSLPKKTWDTIVEVLHLSRSVMTSADLSAVLRQGGFIALAHPVRAAKSFPAMLKAFASERAQFAVEQEIASRPNAPLYAQAKLFLADQSTHLLTRMEEAYASRWAGKIPLVAGSQRAYVTFLNKLRADSFDAMAATFSREGKVTLEEAKAIANFVNVASGRGTVPGAAANAAAGLNAIFFAPRYVISRFQLIFGQPFYKGTARTRLLVAKEYARYLAGVGVVYALAALFQDDKDPPIELDSKSTDFLKIRFGKTRLDPLSGLAQVAVFSSRETRALSRFITQSKKKQPKYGSGGDVLGRFLRSKLSPAVGSVVNALAGRDVTGKPATPASIVVQLIAPISFGDIYRVMQEQDISEGIALSLLALFGAGVQTYESTRPISNSPH